MSDLVGNPEDRFSRVAARILHGHVVFFMENQLNAKVKVSEPLMDFDT